jgi:hypothetical protein
MELLGKETINDVELNENGENPNPNTANSDKQIDPAEVIKPVSDADNPNGEEQENQEPKLPRTVFNIFRILQFFFNLLIIFSIL